MEKSNYKISVIVAVYNAEDYLCNCCNSILAQTYRNIELILVMMGQKITVWRFVKRFRQVIRELSLLIKKTVDAIAHGTRD